MNTSERNSIVASFIAVLGRIADAEEKRNALLVASEERAAQRHLETRTWQDDYMRHLRRPADEPSSERVWKVCADVEVGHTDLDE